MILTCPECATSYFVDDDRIPPVGRSVKCSSCGARWKALPDGEVAPVPAPAPPPAAAKPTPPEDLDFVPTTPPKAARRPGPRDRAGPKPPRAMIIGLGVLVLLGTGLGAAAIFREQVAGMAPGSAKVFAAVGLPVNTIGLNFETVTWKPTFVAGRPVMAVAGAIRNTTKHSVETPPVRISLMDKQGRALAEYQLTVTNGRVPPGGVRHFATNLPDPPAGMVRFDIAFDPGAAKPAAHAGREPAAHAPEPVEARPLPADSPDALPHHE